MPPELPLSHRKWPERWIETLCQTDEDGFVYQSTRLQLER